MKITSPSNLQPLCTIIEVPDCLVRPSLFNLTPVICTALFFVSQCCRYMTMPIPTMHAGAQGNPQSNSMEPSRKRRRQAVVCTECRRRKIACDRNIPCAQCLQSKSSCTFYNSYHSYSDDDHTRSASEGQQASQPKSTLAIGQTTYANPISPQLSLAPVTDDRTHARQGRHQQPHLPMQRC